MPAPSIDRLVLRTRTRRCMRRPSALMSTMVEFRAWESRTRLHRCCGAWAPKVYAAGGLKSAYWMATRTEPPVKLPLVAVTMMAVGL